LLPPVRIDKAQRNAEAMSVLRLHSGGRGLTCKHPIWGGAGQVGTGRGITGRNGTGWCGAGWCEVRRLWCCGGGSIGWGEVAQGGERWHRVGRGGTGWGEDEQGAL